MSKYTFNNGYLAHNMTRTGFVTVPDQVADNQKEFDGETFPVIKSNGTRGRARLVGDEYGLWTSGTGDMVVSIQ